MLPFSPQPAGYGRVEHYIILQLYRVLVQPHPEHTAYVWALVHKNNALEAENRSSPCVDGPSDPPCPLLHGNIQAIGYLIIG